ncbi:undecaprenyldiphospho-muramoylpentapeptide beta-N-acetylglucosaminyltransferase [bacterium endosymbiont of Pedicinus badii]|uniref:undecaprenyldiphospho-muramoylpentapeptide beta-N-acetylglucosaminyltransferase n=1 Tax=bacterium endosymbiont of Pedicinus badii TaxID=1719126 RepID=UPI0009BB1147|nr:undecaprenyldiphospho-muramoylpentapeptide beta-N-acetylglucosaminyltransferase [bacterium endosymbiont of Pedicinus badii]OQM34220.1 hypothetical protein AOQ89_02710 [bacterium endosymbiont of Pedicinus badii]
MKKNKKILIVAGGSGGHIFPGITIAKYLNSKGWEVVWLGSDSGIESIIIPKQNIKYFFFRILKINQKNFINKVKSICYFIASFFSCFFLVKKIKPKIVIGMGNYISVPGVFSAFIQNIPIFLQEQNIVIGRANFFLSYFAKKVFFGFPNHTYCNKKYKFIGNPIRKNLLNFVNPKKKYFHRNGRLKILVLGGSQGSKEVNEIFIKVARKLNKKIDIWHQVGYKNFQEMKNQYSLFQIKNYKISKFIKNIKIAYKWADLVICRSGGITVSEIACIGIAAIFIPFSHKNQHQYWNAKYLSDKGAAKIITDKYRAEKDIINTILSLDRNKILSMSEIAKKMFIKNFLKNLLKEIQKYADR